MQGLVVAVFRPEIGVGGDHSVEGHHRPRPGLVDQVEPDAHVLGLAVLDDAVAELGVVRSVHLADVQQHRVVADDVVGKVTNVVDRRVLPNVARDDHAVADACRHLQIVMLQHDRFEPGDADQPGKLAAA